MLAGSNPIKIIGCFKFHQNHWLVQYSSKVLASNIIGIQGGFARNVRQLRGGDGRRPKRPWICHLVAPP